MPTRDVDEQLHNLAAQEQFEVQNDKVDIRLSIAQFLAMDFTKSPLEESLQVRSEEP
jgi:hypothetical protein